MAPLGREREDHQPQLKLGEKMLSALSGSLLTSLLVTPFDVVKTRMQTALSNTHEKRTSTAPIPPRKMSPPFPFLELGEGTSTCRVFSHAHSPLPPGFYYYPFDTPSPPWETKHHTVNDTKTTRPPFRGTWDGIKTIAKTEGLTSLWRGLSAALVMSVPSTLIYYVGYEYIRDELQRHLSYSSLLPPLLAGSMARTAAVTIISPIELIRVRSQSGISGHSVGEVIRGLRMTVQQHGPSALWRGLAPTLWRDVPFSALYWVGYETLRLQFSLFFAHHFSSTSLLSRPESTSWAMISSPSSTLNYVSTQEFLSSFLAGSISGTFAAILTSPFDVVKTVQQVERAHQTVTTSSIIAPVYGSSIAQNRIPYKPKGLFASLHSIMHKEGIKGLFRGLSPRIAKVAPACGIMISSYEMGKRFFHELAAADSSSSSQVSS